MNVCEFETSVCRNRMTVAENETNVSGNEMSSATLKRPSAEMKRASAEMKCPSAALKPAIRLFQIDYLACGIASRALRKAAPFGVCAFAESVLVVLPFASVAEIIE